MVCIHSSSVRMRVLIFPWAGNTRWNLLRMLGSGSKPPSGQPRDHGTGKAVLDPRDHSASHFQYRAQKITLHYKMNLALDDFAQLQATVSVLSALRRARLSHGVQQAERLKCVLHL